MSRTSTATRSMGALLLSVALVACSETTAPTMPVASLPSLHDRALMPPGHAPLYPMLSTSPCASGGVADGPMLAVSGSDVSMTILPHPGTGGRIMAVNDLGVAVGFAMVGGQPAAYKWTPSGGTYIMTALGNPVFAGGASEAWGINDNGDIVGYGRSSSGAMRAVVWPGGVPGGVALASYGVAPYTLASAATDINDAGKIVGYAAGVSGGAVLFRAMVFTTASATPVPGSEAYVRSAANGVNDAGDVAGDVSTTATGIYQAARNLASVGSWEVLSPLPTFDRGSGQDINAFEFTAGYSQKLPANTADRGAYWAPTTAALLDTVSYPPEGQAVSSYAFGVSSPALAADVRVAGWTNYMSGARHATLWQPGVADPIDLGKPTGTCSSVGTSIADGGDFVCGYFLTPGQDNPLCWEVKYPPELKSFVVADAACNEEVKVSATFSAKTEDAGPWHYVISWGDGSVTEGDAPTPGTIEATKDYAAYGTYDVKVTITDANGRSVTSDVKQVTKAPCPPEVAVVASKTLYACGEAAEVTATFTSPVADAGPYRVVISWGDGATTEETVATPGSLTRTHSYAAFGSYTVTVTVENAFGDRSEASTQVNVDKCSPGITALDITAVTACDEKALLTGTFTVTNNPGPFNATIVWGDGQTETIAVTPGTQFSAEHAYGANGTYAVTVTVSDTEGRSDATSVQTTKDCSGAACTFTIGYWKNHTENWPAGYSAGMKFLSSGSGAVTWLAALSTPTKGNAFWILARQWAGAKLNAASGAPMRSDVAAALADGEAWLRAHLNADGSPMNVGESTMDGQQAVHLGRILDEFNNGQRGTPHCDDGPGTPPPTDTPPEITEFLALDTYLACGEKASVNGTFTADAIDNPWTYTIAWGDGSTTTGSGTPGTPINATHDYVKNGTFTVTFTVKDKDGDTASKTTAITVNCPDFDFDITELTLTDASIECVKDRAYLRASFSGAPEDGPYTYSLTWGDGTAAQTGSLTPGSPLDASHAYATGGSYTITFTVTNHHGTSISKKALVTVTCESALGCGYTHGYWKNHPEAWPAGFSPSAKFLSTGPKAITWLASMSTPPSGNSFYILSQQWSAAKLNAAKGAFVRADVATALTEGEALLRKYIHSNGSVKTMSGADAAEAVRLGGILDDYNNGRRGTPHCD